LGFAHSVRDERLDWFIKKSQQIIAKICDSHTHNSHKGLPSGASWQDLKDHMREIGEVCYAEVKKDGSGTGLVEFLHSDDMKEAIKKLNDSQLRSHEGASAHIRLKEYERSKSRSRSASPKPRRRRSPTRSRSRSSEEKERVEKKKITSRGRSRSRS
jgi:RNA recognition motif-containing protein